MNNLTASENSPMARSSVATQGSTGAAPSSTPYNRNFAQSAGTPPVNLDYSGEGGPGLNVHLAEILESSATEKMESPESAAGSPPVPAAEHTDPSANADEIIAQLDGIRSGSVSLGVKGFFEALIDFCKSDASWTRAKLNVATRNCLQNYRNQVNDISNAMGKNIATVDPMIAEAYASALNAMGEEVKTHFKGVVRAHMGDELNKPGNLKDFTAKRLCINATRALGMLRSMDEEITAEERALNAVSRLNPHGEGRITGSLLKLACKIPELFEVKIRDPQRALSKLSCFAVQCSSISEEQLQKIARFAKDYPDDAASLLQKTRISVDEFAHFAKWANVEKNIYLNRELVQLYTDDYDKFRQLVNLSERVADNDGVVSSLVRLCCNRFVRFDQLVNLAEEIDDDGDVPALVQLLVSKSDKFDQLVNLLEESGGDGDVPALVQLCISESDKFDQLVNLAEKVDGDVPTLVQLCISESDKFGQLVNLAEKVDGNDVQTLVQLCADNQVLFDQLVNLAGEVGDEGAPTLVRLYANRRELFERLMSLAGSDSGDDVATLLRFHRSNPKAFVQLLRLFITNDSAKGAVLKLSERNSEMFGQFLALTEGIGDKHMHKFILECTGNQQLFERLMNLVEKTDGNDAPTLVRLCVGNVGIYVKKELEISPDARVAILEDLREKAPDEFKKLIDLAKKNPRKAVELMPLHSSDRGRFNRELEEASSRAGAPKGET